MNLFYGLQVEVVLAVLADVEFGRGHAGWREALLGGDLIRHLK